LKAGRGKAYEKFKNEEGSKSTFTNPFYMPKTNEQKNGSAIIRLLPDPDPDALPYVLRQRHLFKGDDGRWLVEDLCPTTYNEPCPVCECNNKLWNTGDETYKNIARARGRRKQYVCNAYVIKDPLSPEREGNVYPFAFGPEIFGIIKRCIAPDDLLDEEEPCFPFDLWEGADFNIRITWQADKRMPTYINSKFIKRGTPLLGGDDAAIAKVLEQCQPLGAWIDPAKSLPHAKAVEKCRAAYLHTLDITNPLPPAAPATRLPTDDDLPTDWKTKDAVELPAEEPSAKPAANEDDGPGLTQEPPKAIKAKNVKASTPQKQKPAQELPRAAQGDISEDADDDDDLAYFKQIAAR
jgi:hypothetical protein